MKIWMMLNNDIDDVSFESSEFNGVMQETIMTEDERAEVKKVLDRIYAIYNELENYENAKKAKAVRKKMTSETHMVSLVPFIEYAITDNITDVEMAEFMVRLFGNGVLVSDEYADACKGGSAKNVNIKRRNDEIEKVWFAFINDNSFVEETEDDEDHDYNDF